MKILIVDDEQISLFLTQRMLVVEGISEDEDIYTFMSAKEALSYLSKCSDSNLPDLILLDINMPHVDGWQFLDALAPIWSRLETRCKIYILTTSLDLTDAARAEENPMICSLISKPITSEKVRELFSKR